MGNQKLVFTKSKSFLGWCLLPHILFNICRLYYDLNMDDPVLPKLCELSCHSNLDLCDIQRLPGNPLSNLTYMFPMTWRFIPTLDPQVDIYLSRDLDSEFNDREIAGKFCQLLVV